MPPDLRTPLRRWLDPHRRGWLVVVSVAWFVVGLSGYIAGVVAYGPWTGAIHHGWSLVAWLVFWTWYVFGTRLHRRQR